MKALVLVLAVLLSGTTQAAVYKYVDANGRITYTNVPMRGSQRVDLAPLSSYRPSGESAAVSPRSSSSGGSASSTPRPAGSAGAYPQVSADTQKQRDAGRRKILEDELGNEQKALADARKALTDGEATRNGNEKNYQKYLDRVQKLKDAVTDREKNVAAIRKELGQQ
ncbi:DUF4124 domain-containing protein [Crenobacter cavernae]|uniref:DUF4124 domain-containing protein n=1 Tax=Crenobacter cavernae TaxID=2290923 RepID=A0ABY0FFA1_9NEIS|nr:DUF4124 domain-containing protein [Crenobacter cavernae]RXZ44985.1 DUF4124 domain-containing protein [Crenobacter cavernae]